MALKCTCGRVYPAAQDMEPVCNDCGAKTKKPFANPVREGTRTLIICPSCMMARDKQEGRACAASLGT